jgi:SET domain
MHAHAFRSQGLCMSDGAGPFPVHVVDHRTRGRQLLATEDVQPGHLLLRALPLACVPADTELDLRCSACLTPLDDSTSPCVCRSRVCEQCRPAWSRVHSAGECVSLRHLSQLPRDNSGRGTADSGAARLLMRLAYLQLPQCSPTSEEVCPVGDALSDTVDVLEDLVSHWELLAEVETQHACAMADTVRQCLLACARQSRERLAILAATMWCNCFDVVDPQSGESIGEGVWPSVALALNHSCEPNADVVWEPGNAGAMAVRALRPIAANEEVCIAYCGLFASAESRQRHLRATYHFDCACSRCKSGDGGAPHVPPLLTTLRQSMVDGSWSDAAAAATAVEAAVAPLVVGAPWCLLTLCRARWVRMQATARGVACGWDARQAEQLHADCQLLLGDTHPWTREVRTLMTSKRR